MRFGYPEHAYAISEGYQAYDRGRSLARPDGGFCSSSVVERVSWTRTEWSVSTCAFRAIARAACSKSFVRLHAERTIHRDVRDAIRELYRDRGGLERIEVVHRLAFEVRTATLSA